jgi:hypothetical protein
MPNIEVDPLIKKEINDEGFESETPDSGAAVLIGKKEEMPQLLRRMEKKGKTEESSLDVAREDLADDISGLTYDVKRNPGNGEIRGVCETSSIEGIIGGKKIILVEKFYPGSHGFSDLLKCGGQLDGRTLDHMEAKDLFFKYKNLLREDGRLPKRNRKN